MAVKPLPQVDDPLDLGGGWREGSRQMSAREVHRNSAVATCQIKGGVRLNVTASKLSDEVALARGIAPEEGYILRYLTNKGEGQMGLYASKISGPGSLPTKRDASGASPRISLHAGAAYLECPSIRPTEKVKAMVTLGTHPKDGLPILVVAVKAGSGTLTRHREEK